MPIGVDGEIAKLPVLSLSLLSVNVMLTVGVSVSTRVARGEASILTVQVSDMPSGRMSLIGALVKVGARGVA